MLAQWLCSIAILLPGAQSIRMLLRMVPYCGNALLIFPYSNRMPSWTRFPGTTWLACVFMLLLIELLHPESALIPGIGQIIFCTVIFAPAFWGGKAIRDKRRLDGVLYLLFLFNATSALVGFIQGRYGLLMPSQFSSVTLAIDPNKVKNLTYVGSNGLSITRPAGLSDFPGGAAGAAVTTIILGTALALGLRRFGVKSLAYLLLVAVAGITLYLTQVRVMFIAMILGLLAMVWGVGRHSTLYAARISIVGAGLLAAAFLYAVSIGGTSVSDRFATLISASPGETYRTNRGAFLQATVNELLPQYPFGAGLGRWGMAQVYTSRYAKDTDPPPLYVEIQATGWLLDGGFLMWIFYGAAILTSLFYAYRAARMNADRDVRYLAGIILTLNLLPVMMVVDFPVFNYQLGAQFWLLSSGLAGVCESEMSRNITHQVSEDRMSWAAT